MFCPSLRLQLSFSTRLTVFLVKKFSLHSIMQQNSNFTNLHVFSSVFFWKYSVTIWVWRKCGTRICLYRKTDFDSLTVFFSNTLRKTQTLNRHTLFVTFSPNMQNDHQTKWERLLQASGFDCVKLLKQCGKCVLLCIPDPVNFFCRLIETRAFWGWTKQKLKHSQNVTWKDNWKFSKKVWARKGVITRWQKKSSLGKQSSAS